MGTVGGNLRSNPEIAGERCVAACRRVREHLDDLWDQEFEEDVNAGRLDQAIARARQEYPGGEN
jgi:hypothetical protein